LTLTPKGPLSVQRTNGIWGMYLHAYKFVGFSENFIEGEELRGLLGGIIFFSFGPSRDKLCTFLSKLGERRQLGQGL